MQKGSAVILGKLKGKFKMATDKTFTVCGVSTSTDGTKVRFANDVMRTKVLHKNGHTDILLIELPSDMLKVDAVNFIKDIPEFAGDAAQQAISEYLEKHTPKAKVERKPAAPKAVTVKAPKAKAAKAAEPAVDLTDAEDAPF